MTQLKAQTTLTGKVTDARSGEPLIGATVLYGKGMGTATDIEGNFLLSVPKGERKIQVSYVGYKAISKILLVNKETQKLDFKLKTILLNEVQVVAGTCNTCKLAKIACRAPPSSWIRLGHRENG